MSVWQRLHVRHRQHTQHTPPTSPRCVCVYLCITYAAHPLAFSLCLSLPMPPLPIPRRAGLVCSSGGRATGKVLANVP